MQAVAIAIPAIYRSTVGKKAVMAVTGGVLVLYLILHMIGNLKIFLGAEDFNHYAHWLRTMGEPAVPHRTVLTLIEVVLGASVVLHMWSAVSLARRASAARPVKYRSKKKSHAQGYATRTMRYGGVIIAVYIVWHLLDLTFFVVNPKGGDATPYERMVADFDPSRWYITVWYVVAVLLVGLHLHHGVWSAFQTLGLRTPRSERALRSLAGTVAALVTLGFISVPLSITFGWVS
ncbi:succinate dehydrogenase / fumarate reductase cytochrome b subunit [Actinomadura madurae]|uniref:Succinate dehydrogenase / fumarate reductase cytochrome b subunit n=1 Tax=Actinomadura madurae TaxID=1993 RepID=A0A1I5DF37_9ACTN|nr:succinate dehydrogenase / fumarate reductase cytochrome b subunit [Actinomadura madurae]SPT50363.1 Succinate dehydrogenase/fumarate reductase, cytochrome b subunit [Actinomadura madurae]